MYRTNPYSRAWRILRKVLAWTAFTVAGGTIVLLSYTVYHQQLTINSLVLLAELDNEMDAAQEEKLWDSHRRVTALEGEDERIMAHIRWFVMRRSGTDELRKMQQAIELLENVD